MVYRIRVSLPGMKAFTRLYEVNSNVSLFEFHKQMRVDMDFPVDQLIQFKALDIRGNLVARYGLFDLGYGTVDEISVGETLEKGVRSFTYFYDVTDRKSVTLTFEGEAESPATGEDISLTEVKGPNPAEVEANPAAYMNDPEDTRTAWGKIDKVMKGKLDKSSLKDEEEDDDEDFDLDNEEEEENDEEGSEIFDGSEELGF